MVTELRSLAEADPHLKHPLKNITYSAFKNLAKLILDEGGGLEMVYGDPAANPSTSSAAATAAAANITAAAAATADATASTSSPTSPPSPTDNHVSRAMELYLEASVLDESDPMLWYQMGRLAESRGLALFALARHCYIETVNLSPRHWLALQRLLPILFALNDFSNCLWFASLLLAMNPRHKAARIFVFQIFAEHPVLESIHADYFAPAKVQPRYVFVCACEW